MSGGKPAGNRAIKPKVVFREPDSPEKDHVTVGGQRRKRTWLSEVNWLQAGVLFVLGIAIYVLWGTPFVYPLKILVVFFHEMSHAAVALATGGRVVEIQVNALQGGVCVTQGGNAFAILSAGYLGSLFLGGAILLWAAQTQRPGRIVAGLGLLLIVVAAAFVRPLIGFGFGFGVLAGIALVVSGVKVSPTINGVLLKLIGLTSCMYAVLDIKSDVFMRPELRSDAAMLSDLTGVPTLVWGLLWVVIALPASFYFVLAACRKKGRGAPRVLNP